MKNNATKEFEQLEIRNQNLKKIAKEAYYLDDSILSQFETESLNEILINWDSTNKELLDHQLKSILAQNLNQFRKNSFESLIDRHEIVSTIYDLYKQKNFIALIPLVLSQVDGMMKKITGKHGFYSAYNENKKSNPNKIKFLESEFYLDFFSQFEFLNIENRNEFQLFEKDITDLTKFNRHSILHGESHHFGSEENGIKALLLFIFVGEIYRINT